MTTVSPQLRRRVEELERTENWPALQRLLRTWPWPVNEPPIDPEAAYADVMRRTAAYEQHA